MMTFARRRLRNLALALTGGLLILTSDWIARGALMQTAYISGWAMLALMLLLAAYNLRKKLTVIPLFSSSAWLQVHVYAGVVSVVVFVVHIGYVMPNGGLEILLGVLYVGVAASGLAGLVLTRTLPPRINSRGENVIFERIGAIRRQLRERAEVLALESVNAGNVTAISQLYQDRLVRFFAGPQNLWSHLGQSTRRRQALLDEIDALRRYVKESDRESLTQIAELVCLKDDLDYRYACQCALKGWLFVHIPLTYGLLMVMAVHVVVVYAFSGGAR